ncbi:hypothetical protein C7379_10898, partial [Hallella colorans]
ILRQLSPKTDTSRFSYYFSVYVNILKERFFCRANRNNFGKRVQR